jgi:hypothetical protein
VTTTPRPYGRIDVGGAPAIGEIDNERPSSRTYATATGESSTPDLPRLPDAASRSLARESLADERGSDDQQRRCCTSLNGEEPYRRTVTGGVSELL